MFALGHVSFGHPTECMSAEDVVHSFCSRPTKSLRLRGETQGIPEFRNEKGFGLPIRPLTRSMSSAERSEWAERRERR